MVEVDAIGVGIGGVGLLVEDEYGAGDTGIVGVTEGTDVVGDEIGLLVGVHEGEDAGGKGGVGEILVGTLGDVLDDIGEEFELIDEVGEERGVDLGELDFPEGQIAQDLFEGGRGDLGSPVVHISGDFRHGRHAIGSAQGWQSVSVPCKGAAVPDACRCCGLRLHP